MRARAPWLALAVALAVADACKAPDVLPIAAAGRTMADSADQVVFGSKVVITDRGLQRASIDSDTAMFFDQNTRVEMIHVYGVFFNSAGLKDAVMVADFGKYNTNLGILEARGSVAVTAVDGRKLTTPFLKFDQRLNQLNSDSAFTVREPDGKETKGIGFKSDADMQNIQVFKHISTKAGPVALPDR